MDNLERIHFDTEIVPRTLHRKYLEGYASEQDTRLAFKEHRDWQRFQELRIYSADRHKRKKAKTQVSSM